MHSLNKSHLEYYREHNIAPVRYDLRNLNAHFERRENLYKKLGLLPLSFRNSDVLEVAAGTGHNSLYIAQLMPAHYTLLEPNATAINYIHRSYQNFDIPHTNPLIRTEMLEDFNPQSQYDIVLCENWLGISEHEQNLLNKLSTFVKKQGIIVLTTVSPIGLLPNLIRRHISNIISHPKNSFTDRTNVIKSALTNHLENLTDMTRNIEDWIHDNMMNPAYYNLCLTIPKIIQQLGDRFDIVNTCPTFSEDWRWFKQLHSNNKFMNEHFEEEYWKKCHNFLDYQQPNSPYIQEKNELLEKFALKILDLIKHYEESLLNGLDPRELNQNILDSINEFCKLLPDELANAKTALKEAINLLQNQKQINASSITSMQHFSTLFGRETGYISLIKL